MGQKYNTYDMLDENRNMVFVNMFAYTFFIVFITM